MDFFGSPVGITIISFAGLVVTLASAIKLYEFFKDNVQGYQYEVEIESLLLPYVYRAIASAYRTSEIVARDFGATLEGLDKKAIADAVYDMLPPTIIGVDINFIKKFVSRQDFEHMIQETFDAFTDFYKRNESEFETLIEEWLKENKPETSS